ncbi:hypothetical protein F4818DRAFT_174969 [Hypoxylon cercidicola]|nr:hypothetical protein F4818DRAFT_174969 [Hypoxylon cercidicola]
MTNEPTKERVLIALEDAAFAFRRPVKLCEGTQNFDGFPEAFPVISKHIPVLSKTLGSMTQYLSEGKETPEVNEKYAGVYELAESCRKEAVYIFECFRTFTTETNIDVASKLEKYRQLVTNANDTKIEDVMKTLLKQAVDVAVLPLVSDDLIKQLQDAQKEVAAVKPSLTDDPRETIKMINNDKGTQFLHNGNGDQNHVSGGIQNTRPNNIYNYGLNGPPS